MEPSGKKSEIAATPPGVRRAVKWIVIAFFAALVATIVSKLPRGYSDDLSHIGKGKPALVLVRDKNAVPSLHQLELMDEVRNHYAERVEFLLTDYDTPAGEAFMQANKAERSTLALFDSNGVLVKILSPQTAAGLAQELDVLAPGDGR